MDSPCSRPLHIAAYMEGRPHNAGQQGQPTDNRDNSGGRPSGLRHHPRTKDPPSLNSCHDLYEVAASAGWPSFMLCLCCCWVRPRALAIGGVSNLVVSIVFIQVKLGVFHCFLVFVNAIWCVRWIFYVCTRGSWTQVDQKELEHDAFWNWNRWNLNFQLPCSTSGFRVHHQNTNLMRIWIPFSSLRIPHDSVFTRHYSMRSFCPWRPAAKPVIDKLVGSYQVLVTTSYWSMVGLRCVDPNSGGTDIPKPFRSFQKWLVEQKTNEFRGP